MGDTNLGAPIGLPLDRVDGRLKVTGQAPYAYEYAAQGAALYGVIVPAAIAKGHVVTVDVSDAQRAPGVRLVLTKDNAPAQHPFGPVDLPDRFARAMPALNNDEVPYFGFPAAFVVADTFEQATAAAAMVHVHAASAPGAAYDLAASDPTAIDPGRIGGTEPADSAIGDFAAAFAAAPVKVDAGYITPYQHQVPMEPHATMAEWHGGKLTVYSAQQLTGSPQAGLARTFNMRKEDVRIITRYVGGGFGSKLPYYVDATLAAMGARILQRPVKVVMTRPQTFYLTSRIGAARAARRRPRRPAHSLWPGRIGADRELRPVRRAGHAGGAHALCGAQPAHPSPPRQARPAALRFDARAGRRDRPHGARMRHGRARPTARPRSGGAAPAQRHADRSRTPPAVRLAPPRRMPARGRGPLRVAAAHRQAGERQRRPLADRARRRVGGPR
jgi:hypothetical protein